MKLKNFEIFNIGSADTIKVMEIAEIVTKEKSLGNVVVLNFTQDELDGRGWKGDVRKFLLDCSLLRGLGWKPKMNSREAVKCAAQLYILNLSEKYKTGAMTRPIHFGSQCISCHEKTRRLLNPE